MEVDSLQFSTCLLKPSLFIYGNICQNVRKLGGGGGGAGGKGTKVTPVSI